MIPALILQWFFHGEWCDIGWEANTEKSRVDLREHGQKLADAGGQYRLVYSEPFFSIVHEYNQVMVD